MANSPAQRLRTRAVGQKSGAASVIMNALSPRTVGGDTADIPAAAHRESVAAFAEHVNKSVGKHFRCCICFSILEDPVMLPCNHPLCRGCATRSLQQHRRCPQCLADTPNLRTVRGRNKWIVGIVDSLRDCLNEVGVSLTQHAPVPSKYRNTPPPAPRHRATRRTRRSNGGGSRSPSPPVTCGGGTDASGSSASDAISGQGVGDVRRRSRGNGNGTRRKRSASARSPVSVTRAPPLPLPPSPASGSDPHQSDRSRPAEAAVAVGDTSRERDEEALAVHDHSTNGCVPCTGTPEQPSSTSALSPTSLPLAQPFAVGELVEVDRRTWPGINKPGGIGFVCAVSDPPGSSYDVKYTVSKRVERAVDARFVHSYVFPEATVGVRSRRERNDRESRHRREAGGGGGGRVAIAGKRNSRGSRVDGARVVRTNDRSSTAKVGAPADDLDAAGTSAPCPRPSVVLTGRSNEDEAVFQRSPKDTNSRGEDAVPRKEAESDAASEERPNHARDANPRAVVSDSNAFASAGSNRCNVRKYRVAGASADCDTEGDNVLATLARDWQTNGAKRAGAQHAAVGAFAAGEKDDAVASLRGHQPRNGQAGAATADGDQVPAADGDCHLETRIYPSGQDLNRRASGPQVPVDDEKQCRLGVPPSSGSHEVVAVSACPLANLAAVCASARLKEQLEDSGNAGASDSSREIAGSRAMRPAEARGTAPAVGDPSVREDRSGGAGQPGRSAGVAQPEAMTHAVLEERGSPRARETCPAGESVKSCIEEGSASRPAISASTTSPPGKRNSPPAPAVGQTPTQVVPTPSTSEQCSGAAGVGAKASLAAASTPPAPPPAPNDPSHKRGDLVSVLSRSSPGVNKEGGVARIIRVNEDGTYNVKYLVRQGTEKGIIASILSPYSLDEDSDYGAPTSGARGKRGRDRVPEPSVARAVLRRTSRANKGSCPPDAAAGQANAACLNIILGDTQHPDLDLGLDLVEEVDASAGGASPLQALPEAAQAASRGTKGASVLDARNGAARESERAGAAAHDAEGARARQNSGTSIVAAEPESGGGSSPPILEARRDARDWSTGVGISHDPARGPSSKRRRLCEAIGATNSGNVSTSLPHTLKRKLSRARTSKGAAPDVGIGSCGRAPTRRSCPSQSRGTDSRRGGEMPVVITVSGVTAEMNALTYSLAKSHDWRVLPTFTEAVTHVVCGATPDTRKAKIRSAKFLGAVASGKWVLSEGWLKECRRRGGRANEENFELAGDRKSPVPAAPRRSRIAHAEPGRPGLFHGMAFLFRGRFAKPESPPRSELESMLVANEGRVVDTIDALFEWPQGGTEGRGDGDAGSSSSSSSSGSPTWSRPMRIIIFQPSPGSPEADLSTLAHDLAVHRSASEAIAGRSAVIGGGGRAGARMAVDIFKPLWLVDSIGSFRVLQPTVVHRLSLPSESEAEQQE